ncbi:winged helix-turn-helix domain-containing protein [uncultured Paludibaculum sp.]|uniref:winged helix-turn-helix domain-containing protein n=1 Tax=uncultured Paludibaculum sp. TaxID=1765020 RepID=UPI002AABCCF9|nr:winged helix-turn-helix domain-containing protein [uncultured Paludibaculum sp.]
MAGETPLHLRELGPDPETQRQLIARILASKPFRRSQRQRELLEFLCRHSFESAGREVHEQEIGVSVFARRPDYDTSQDNIVRVHVSELRKKLEEYFKQEGVEESWLLEIPRGNYTAVLTPRIAPPRDPVPATEPEPPRPRSTYLLSIIGVLSLACAGLVAWNLQLRRQAEAPPSGVNPLWQQMFAGDRETDVVVADSCLSFYTDMVKHPVVLQDYLSRKYLLDDLARERDPERRKSLEMLMGRRYTSYADVQAVQHITRLAALQGKTLNVHFARDYPTRRLQTSNLILVGSKRANLWAELFDDQLNFQVEYDQATGGNVVVNRKPLAGEQRLYTILTRDADIRDSLAVIALVPNLQNTGEVLLLAGTGMSGTEAAIEAAVSPQGFSRIQAALPPHRSGKVLPFEALIRSHAVGGTAQTFEILAARLVEPPAKPRNGL